jgi:hypothetical protein
MVGPAVEERLPEAERGKVGDREEIKVLYAACEYGRTDVIKVGEGGRQEMQDMRQRGWG